jgi:endonuclease YncB( thermonuclease family)
MRNAIGQTKNKEIVGHVGIGFKDATHVDTVDKKVHDGDTVTVRALGNFGVRFLQMDAPEVSCQLKGKGFPRIENQTWIDYLTDPSQGDQKYKDKFSPGLLANLEARFGPQAALNHKKHADKAREELARIIQDDLTTHNLTEDKFEFTMLFMWEVMDRYGRLLGYISRKKLKDDAAEPESYNDRLLKSGKVLPYMIWPNEKLMTNASTVSKAVIPKGKANDYAEKNPRIKSIRAAVKQARQDGEGLFETGDPLLIEPFEIRYLGRKGTPDRWVIDLSKNDTTLIDPQNYYDLLPEDRLFIDQEYVPLFESKGWSKWK